MARLYNSQTRVLSLESAVSTLETKVKQLSTELESTQRERAHCFKTGRREHAKSLCQCISLICERRQAHIKNIQLLTDMIEKFKQQSPHISNQLLKDLDVDRVNDNDDCVSSKNNSPVDDIFEIELNINDPFGSCENEDKYAPYSEQMLLKFFN